MSPKKTNMKILLIVISTFSFLLAVIAFFYRDQFLFFIHGFDKSLIGSTTIDSFAAYKKIYPSKVVLLVAGAELSGLGIFISQKIISSDAGRILKALNLLNIVLLVLFFALLVLMWILPKRLL